MSSKNERICRLCLKVAKNAFREINGVVKQILGVLLLKLDLDITRDPIFCEDCMEVAKKCLDFKSSCIDTEEIIVLFSANREKTRHNIRDIYGEKEQVLTLIDEHLDICRFCLSRLERNNFVSLDSLMNETMVEMLLQYMPETDLNVIENPIICTICRENLDSYFMFVTNCLDTENKITAYCKEVGTDSTGEVTLGNILQFLFGYILQNPKECYRTCKIKQEPNMSKDVDLVHYEPQSELTKLEEELDIKEEEITLDQSLPEVMLDKNGDTFDSNQHDKETKPDISCMQEQTERQSHQKQTQIKVEDVSNRDAFEVNMCESNDTRIEMRILAKIGGKQKKSDLRSNSDASEESLCKHTFCSSKQPCVLKAPVKICEGSYNKQKNNHQEEEDTFKRKKHRCSLCPYRAIKRSRIKNHMLVHVDVKLFKCSLCSFETKHKCSLKVHMLIHTDISEIDMYECSLCAYKSKQKGNLKHHMLIHTDISEIKMYECALCAHKSKTKAGLRKHMSVNKEISEIEIFRCTLCSFETKRKGSLKNHMLMHRDITEIHMYECSLCAYKSKKKGNLKHHMLIHTDISEMKMYECALCAHKSKTKAGLRKHMSVHKEISEIEMSKCSLCSFATKYKDSLKKHMLTHRDISEIHMYECSLCSFATKYKDSLKKHMLTHRDISDINMYECSLCAYKSKTKPNLKRHMSVHKDNSEMKI